MERHGSLGFKIGAGTFILALLGPSCTAPPRDFGASSTGTGGGAGGAGVSTSSGSSGAGGAKSSSSAGSGSVSVGSVSVSASSSSGMSKGCTSAADMTILKDTMTINMAAQVCGQMCLGAANKSACAGDCMTMKAQLSPECSKCWGDRIACALQLCLGPCVQVSSQQCMDCLAANCDAAYNACAGL